MSLKVSRRPRTVFSESAEPGVSACSFRHRFRPVTPRAPATLPVRIILDMYPFFKPEEAK
jgi:hypothetical protein